jgi:gliding motility-associated-like protein
MKILLYLICFIGFILPVHAQFSPDCRTAIPVCADVPFSDSTNGLGDIEDFDPNIITETGCLEKGSVSSANIEHNTSWFIFRALTDGQIGFDIESLSLSAEWDFAVYGSSSVDCLAISNGTAQPIRCNYEVNNTDFTGLGVNPENGQVGAPSLTQNLNTYDEWLDVTAGEIYYILINNFNTNFDGEPEPFSFTFTGDTTALDCTFRDQFLGLDIIACEADPSITLSALRSIAGNDIANVTWSVDYTDPDIPDNTNLLSGNLAAAEELVIPALILNSGRYFIGITTNMGNIILDDILITFFGTPVLEEVITLNTNLNTNPDQNNIEIIPQDLSGNGSFEYAINRGEFQDSPIFLDVPPGVNTAIINDKNGCGTTDAIEFLVVGYPKFFTPNGDLVNDDWNIKGIETLSNPAVFIFDRYGKLLKQLDAFSSWDGTYIGRQMPATDYWFRFEYNADESGIVVAKTTQSHFTLKR